MLKTFVLVPNLWSDLMYKSEAENSENTTRTALNVDSALYAAGVFNYICGPEFRGGTKTLNIGNIENTGFHCKMRWKADQVLVKN